MSDSLQPVDCSMPGFPAHHQLLELAHTHVHRVDDAIQPSHPLSSPSLPAFTLSQGQGLFQWSFPVLRIRWPKYWSFSFSISPSNKYSGLISFIFSFIYLFIYFWPHRASQGILVPQPGIKPVTPMNWKCGILTTRLPGKSLS